MRIEEIRKALRKVPFQAFDIHLSNGRSIHVDHPELVMLTPPGRTIVVWDPTDEAVEIVDVPHIVSLREADNGPKDRGGDAA